ncbi:MAG: hypothetical protein QXU82_01205 [Candidatus Aenigmatarchaeota archaeon]
MVGGAQVLYARVLLSGLSFVLFFGCATLALPFEGEGGSGTHELVVPAEIAAAIGIPVVFAYAGKKYLTKVSWNELKQMYAQGEQKTYHKFFSAIMNAAGSAISTVSSAVSSAVKTVTSVVSSAVSAVSSAVSSIARTVSSAVSSAVNAIVNTAESVAGAAVNAAKTVAKGVFSAASTAANAASKVVSAAANAVSKAASSVGNAISKVVSSGIQVAKQVGSAVLDIGKKAIDMQMKVGNAILNGAAAAGKAVWNGACAVGNWVAKHPYETIAIVGMVALAFTGVGLLADFAAAGTIGLGAIGASSAGATLGSIGTGLFIASDVALGTVFASDVGTAYQEGGWDAAQMVIADKGPMVALTAAGYGAGAVLRPVATMLAKSSSGGVELGATLLKSRGYSDDVIRMAIKTDGGVQRVAELENMGLKTSEVERVVALETGKIKPYSATVMNKFHAEEVVLMEKSLSKAQIEDLSRLKITATVEGKVTNPQTSINALKSIDNDAITIGKIEDGGVKKVIVKEFTGDDALTPARVDAVTKEVEMNSNLLKFHNPNALIRHEAQHLIDDKTFMYGYNKDFISKNLIKNTGMTEAEADDMIRIAEDLLVDSRLSKNDAVSLANSHLKMIENKVIEPDVKILAKDYAALKNHGVNTDDLLSKLDDLTKKDELLKKVEVIGNGYAEESQKILPLMGNNKVTNTDFVDFATKMDRITIKANREIELP